MCVCVCVCVCVYVGSGELAGEGGGEEGKEREKREKERARATNHCFHDVPLVHGSSSLGSNLGVLLYSTLCLFFLWKLWGIAILSDFSLELVCTGLDGHARAMETKGEQALFAKHPLKAYCKLALIEERRAHQKIKHTQGNRGKDWYDIVGSRQNKSICKGSSY